MSRSPAVLALLGLLAAHVTSQADAPPRLSGSRPNILFVFSDDHAAHAISAYGSRINTTPNIDRLAKGGVLFRNNFCGNAICGPSRATILTGKHSHANGFMRNGNQFDGAQTTFPKLLQAAGYQTVMLGKWHLGSDPTGFDHWMVLPGQGNYYNPDFLTPEGRVRLTGHVTDLTTQLAIDWLEKERDPQRPFLLMCQHKAPHRSWMPAPSELGLYRDADIPEPDTLFDDYEGRAEPARHQEMEVDRHMTMFYDLKLVPNDAERAHLQEPDVWWEGPLARMTPEQRRVWDAAFAAENEAFRRDPPTGKALVRWKYQRYIKNYLRCVAGVDRSVGRLLDWLDAHPDVKANTLFVYSSDQGFYLGDNGWFDKRWMYEPSFRMPLLVAWPGHIGAARELTQLAQNIDFAPTFLDLAGVKVPADVHGTSLVPLLEARAPSTWRDRLYYHYYESQATHMVAAHYGVRTERYKLIHYYEPQFDSWELFDLQTDPTERHSVADDERYKDVRTDLQRALEDLRRGYDDETGQVGTGAFSLVAGIARAVPVDHGWQVWANTGGGYLLNTGARPGSTTFTTTLRSLPGRPQRNGYVVFSGSDDARAALVRAGIEFGARRLAIVGADAASQRAAVELDLAGHATVELTVTVDLAQHRVVARALGREVSTDLPASWERLTAWGLGASNAETVFGRLDLR